jgi:hypothetical protein
MIPAICGNPCAPTGALQASKRLHRPAHGENKPVDLARLAWLVTVFVCLIAVVILVLQGYLGYAAVTFAVAASAGINLT